VQRKSDLFRIIYAKYIYMNTTSNKRKSVSKDSNDLTVSQIVELQRQSHADGTIKRLKTERENETTEDFEKRIFQQAAKDKQDRNDAEIARYKADTHKYMSRDGNSRALLQDSRLWDTPLDNPPINKKPDLKPVAIYSKPTDGNPIDEAKHNWQQKWFRQNESVNHVIREKNRDYGWRKRFLEGYHTALAAYHKSDEYKNVNDNLYPKFREEQDNKWKAEKEEEDDRLNRLLGIKPKTPSHKPREEPAKSNYDIIKSNQQPDTYYYYDKINNNVRWLMPEDEIPIFPSSKHLGNFYYTDKATNEQRWVLLKDTYGGKRKSQKKQSTKKRKGKGKGKGKKRKGKGTRKNKI
tara:strand:- start:6439 stop:7488 length:1050 start_codon:yes stop_codon:yes gene_type:complete